MSEDKNMMSTLSVKERITRLSDELVINKTGWNSYGNYAYVTPEDLDNALKPLLVKYRLFVHFDVIRTQDNRNAAVLTIEDFDSEDGMQHYSMNVEDISLKAANVVQSAGGLRTFCSRYLKMTAFSVSENVEDLDSDVKRGEEENEKPKKTSAPKSEAKNPDEKIKGELIEACKEKINALGGDKSKVNEVLKKYEPDNGIIGKMTTANAKKALADIKKIPVEVNE